MRKFAILLLVAASTIAAAAQQEAPAQQAPEGQGQRAARAHGQRRDPQQMVDRRVQGLSRHLNLSTDQEAQVRKIYSDQFEQMKAARQNGTSMSKEDRRAQMMQAQQNTSAQIRSILTPDQQTRFDKMQAKMKERGQGRRGHHGAPPSNPS